jgi:hypothetical protein
MSILNQLLSFATWIEDAPSDLLPGWSGNLVPVRVPKARHQSPYGSVKFWHFRRRPLDDAQHRKVLGIYREARNLQDLLSIPYAILGYYKILEVKFPNGDLRTQWIEAHLEQALKDKNIPLLEKLLKEAGDTPKQLANFMYVEGRNAVAHTKFANSIDPDDITQIQRLSLALPIFQRMARDFILNELGVSDSQAD